MMKQRGNMVIVLILSMVILSLVYVVVESAVGKMQVEKTRVTDVQKLNYEFKSLKNAFKSSMIYYLAEERLPVTSYFDGYETQYYMDFNHIVVDHISQLQVRKLVSETLGEDYGDRIDFRFSTGNLEVGDFCNTDREDITCETTGPDHYPYGSYDNTVIEGSMLLTSGGRQEIYSFEIYGLSGGLDEQKSSFVYDVSNLVIDIKKIYDPSEDRSYEWRY